MEWKEGVYRQQRVISQVHRAAMWHFVEFAELEQEVRTEAKWRAIHRLDEAAAKKQQN